MSSFAELISAFERSRRAGEMLEEPLQKMLVGAARTKDDLLQIFDHLPMGPAVASRVADYLFQRSRQPIQSLQPAPLVQLTRSHLAESRLMARRREQLRSEHKELTRWTNPVSDSELALFDMVAEFPIRVVATPEDLEPESRLAIEIRGSAQECFIDETPGEILTPVQMKAFAGYCAWWTVLEELQYSASPEWRRTLFATHELTHGVDFLHGYLVSPAVPTPFDFSYFYRIWESGASLWLHGDHVQLRLFGAHRWGAHQTQATWILQT